MSATLTVDQITKDTITQISYRYWSPPDENQKLEPFEANLIEDIYTNELLNSRYHSNKPHKNNLKLNLY